MADIYSQGDDQSLEQGNGEVQGDEELLEQARARFKLALEAEADNRRLAAEDRRFRKGDQWPEYIKQAREAEGRPCLTINKMPQFEQQVTNDQRQNRPSIKVHPVDDEADPETAKIFQGVIKHIEVSSGADTARDTAFENAVRGSYGFYRVVTEYTSPESFNQEIRVKRIRDADSVLLDPHHQESDGSDCEWGFIFERVSKDKYCLEYGESELANKDENSWEAETYGAPDWLTRDSVIVAEYFYKEYEDKELVLLSDGQTLEKSEAQSYIASTAVQATDEQGLPMGEPVAQIQIVKERKAKVPTIKWCKLNGVEVLSKTDWPGKWIPILPVYGAEIVVDGKVIRESLIRHAKDPARMYNFWKSAETEAITLAPKAPFVAEEHQLEGYESDWASANRKNHAFLKYKAHSVNGTPLPPPQRQSFEPAVQAITQASMLAADEIKSTTGIYDSSLGARSNETSGKAILARNNQAQTSNFHFTDNLNRTIRHEGRILVDLIPKIYDTARTARIIGEEGEHKVVKLNQPTGEIGKDGKELIYRLDVGTYDVTIDTGPSFATKRLEATQFMQEMVRSYPQTMQVAGDLVMKSMDVPGASELAERFKKTLPPNLIEDPNQKQPQIPPQIQAQMQSMNQMIEQLTQQLHAAQDEKDKKLIEIESRERIEMAKLESQATIELAKLQSKEALDMLAHQIAEIDARTKMLGFMQPFPSDDDGAQDMTPMPSDGAYGAGVGGMDQNLTGEESPGLPMEGQPPNVDPYAN